MKTKTSTETKRNLTIEELVERSVASSCGVEGIKVDFKKASHAIPKRHHKKIYESVK